MRRIIIKKASTFNMLDGLFRALPYLTILRIMINERLIEINERLNNGMISASNPSKPISKRKNVNDNLIKIIDEKDELQKIINGLDSTIFIVNNILSKKAKRSSLVKMKYVDNMTYEQIGKTVYLTAEGVRKRIKRELSK